MLEYGAEASYTCDDNIAIQIRCPKISIMDNLLLS